VTTQDYAADAAQNEIIIYDGTVELERFHYADADIEALVTLINDKSDWLTAELLEDGTALEDVTSQPLTEGNDGATLTAEDWTELMEALETERFAVFVPYDLTDSEVRESLVAWAQELNENGKRFMTVIGGEAAEEVEAAAERSEAIDDENFVNVGVGTVVDQGTFGDDELELSTSRFAPRVAGALAGRGESLSLTFARFADVVRLEGGPTEADILTAFDAGVVVLARDSNADAPIRVEKGLTTYTTDTDTDKPYLIYRQPKFVMTMQAVERELTEYAESNVIGLLPVNDKTRQLLIGEFGARLSRREDVGILQKGSTVGVDPDPPPSDSDEFVALVYGVLFGRSTEQVFNVVRVG
jgi:hypothetical protein